MRVLTPTENRRLNEMVGFLGITLAILIALALLSYSPHDSSFNVAAQAPESHPARNWIGPAGAYGADLLFQVFGYAAFLLPMGICALGLRWFRSHPLDSAIATLVGYAMLILSVPSLLALWQPPGRAWRDSSRRIAGHAARGGTARGLQFRGRAPGGPGRYFSPRCS